MIGASLAVSAGASQLIRPCSTLVTPKFARYLDSQDVHCDLSNDCKLSLEYTTNHCGAFSLNG